MDSYETLSSMGMSNLKSNYGQQDNLKSDSCGNYGSILGGGLTKDEQQSTRSIKYYQTTFQDLDPSNLSSLSRGINFNDGFGVSGDLIDINSRLRNAAFSGKPCDGLGPTPLPTTAGFYRGHGDIAVENQLRPLHDRQRKACNPRETHYYNRTMNVFSDNIPSPFANANDFVLPNNLFYGVDSRGASSKKYDRRYTGTPESNCETLSFRK